MDLNKETLRTLISKAMEMRRFAYVPYSKYSVGAALLSSDDTIFTGCNVENAAFTPSNCAERTAFFKAVSEGVRKFKAIAVSAGPEGEDSTDYASPCGVCRQVMTEFCNPEDFLIICVKNKDEYKIFKLKELLPDAFGGDAINTTVIKQQ